MGVADVMVEGERVHGGEVRRAQGFLGLVPAEAPDEQKEVERNVADDVAVRYQYVIGVSRRGEKEMKD